MCRGILWRTRWPLIHRLLILSHEVRCLSRGAFALQNLIYGSRSIGEHFANSDGASVKVLNDTLKPAAEGRHITYTVQCIAYVVLYFTLLCRRKYAVETLGGMVYIVRQGCMVCYLWTLDHDQGYNIFFFLSSLVLVYYGEDRNTFTKVK